MPTPARTWTISQNNATSDKTSDGTQVKEILLDIKTKMLACGWTVTQSSDSSTADTSDNWSNVGDVVHATSGAHSWIVLKSPANFASTGKYIYFGIDYISSNDATTRFASRGDADWTGLDASTGPANAGTGTATGQNIFYEADQYIVPTANPDCKFHSATTATGDIIYYVSNATSGQVHFAMWLNKHSDFDSADLYPVSHFSYGKNTTSTGQHNMPFYSTYLQGGRYTKIFHYSSGIGSASYNLGGIYGYEQNSTWWSGAASGATGGDIGGKIPLVPIYPSGQYPSGTRGPRGYATDLWLCHVSTTAKAAIGDVNPGSGDIKFGCIGGFWVPCSVAPDFT